MAINTEVLLLPAPVSPQSSQNRSVRTEVFQQRLKDQQKEQLEQAATRSQPLARALSSETGDPGIMFQNERYAPTSAAGGLVANLPAPWRGSLFDALI